MGDVSGWGSGCAGLKPWPVCVWAWQFSPALGSVGAHLWNGDDNTCYLGKLYKLSLINTEPTGTLGEDHLYWPHTEITLLLFSKDHCGDWLHVPLGHEAPRHLSAGQYYYISCKVDVRIKKTIHTKALAQFFPYSLCPISIISCCFHTYFRGML